MGDFQYQLLIHTLKSAGSGPVSPEACGDWQRSPPGWWLPPGCPTGTAEADAILQPDIISSGFF